MRLSCYLGFDPFRVIQHKERIGVEREHHVQGATGVLLPCHLECAQDALGLYGQRRRTGRTAIHLDTNSYHSDPPSACDALYAPFTPLLLQIGNNSAKRRQQRDTLWGRAWIRHIAESNAFRYMLLRHGVWCNAGACLVSIERRMV